MTVLPLNNEASILQELQAGSADAFTSIYHHYSPIIYVAVLKMVKDPTTAQEIVQDVFSTIWRKHNSLEINNLSAYLFKAGQHKVFNFYKKLQQDKAKLQDFKVYAEAHYSHVEEALHYEESRDILQQVLDKLPQQQRKVYEMIRIEGRSYKDAAAQLGLSTYTVKEYLVYANKKIRNYFENNLDVLVLLVMLFEIRKF